MQIPTKTGSLEASYQPPPASTQSPVAALLCHPHPQYGGNMHDQVLQQAAQCFPAHLRFNFRGVGGSSGSFDNGLGEVDDVVAAWQWLGAQHQWTDLVLVGYSFGAAMAWQAQGLCLGLSRLVLIAPPSAAMPLIARSSLRSATSQAPGSPPLKQNPVAPSSSTGAVEQTTAPAPVCEVIAGDCDTFFDPDRLPKDCRQTILSGADHFFAGKLPELAHAIRGMNTPDR